LRPQDGKSRSLPAVDQTAMLVEWARRAAAGGRYIEPPGDNLVELLGRIAAVAPAHPELARLRQQAATSLAKKAKEQLQKRHTLAAQGSYQALLALQPEAPFPRTELAVQLSALARVMSLHKGRQKALGLAQTAVELAPKQAVTHLALGDALLAQGQRSAAAAEYRRALELTAPGNLRRQAQRGLARATRGRLAAR
jgi:tetratricopeptide (TPR) repeat protein